MLKRIIAVCLLIIVIILFFTFYAKDNLILHNDVRSTEVIGYEDKNQFLFLSDEYFNEIDSLFEQIKKENGQRGIFNNSKGKAANTVIEKMMDDLENNPDQLPNHKNYKRFFETFDKYIRQLDTITERMHYFRNTLNAYSGAPTKLEDMIDLAARGEWHLFDAKFHRYNYGDNKGALNVKFLSTDGRFEAVYNTGTGKIATDPANMGTYNYSPGSINPIKFYHHYKYDRKPWEKWGNVKGFSYQDIMSLKSEHGTKEANNNEKEVKRLIQQRKNELGK